MRPTPLRTLVVTLLVAIPVVLGSPLGWVPAVVYVFLAGRTWAATGLFVYSLVLVSGIDNVVKPLILRGGAQIHPLLGFLSILGGVLAFGFHGFETGARGTRAGRDPAPGRPKPDQPPRGAATTRSAERGGVSSQESFSPGS